MRSRAIGKIAGSGRDSTGASMTAMRSRNRPAIVAGIVGTTIAVAVVVAFARNDVVATVDVRSPQLPLLQVVLAVVWWLPGAALAWWRPTLPFAWLVLGASAAHAVAGLVSGLAPADNWAQWVVSWMILIELPLLGAFVQLFPSGRPTGRWRRYLVFSMVAGALGLVAAAIEALPTASSSLSSAAGAVMIPLLAFTAIGCVVPLVARFRQSVEGERRAVGFVAAVVVTSLVVPGAVAGGGESGEVFGQVFTAVMIAVVTAVILSNRIWGSAPMLRRSLHHAVNATDAERRRIRAELHDGVGAGLTSVRMKIDAAKHLIDSRPERAAEMLGLASAEVGTLVQDVRRMVEGIRPAVLDHVSVFDALDARARELSDGAAIVIKVDRMDDLQLTPAAETALYRIVNEALTNVVRHAHASRCDVRFATTPDSLVAEVIDNGVGTGPSEPGRHGVGLSSMAVRANEVGGFVTAGPLSGRGFSVTATLPRTRPSQPGPDSPAIFQTLGHGDESPLQPSATVTTKEAGQCPSE